MRPDSTRLPQVSLLYLGHESGLGTAWHILKLGGLFHGGMSRDQPSLVSQSSASPAIVNIFYIHCFSLDTACQSQSFSIGDATI